MPKPWEAPLDPREAATAPKPWEAPLQTSAAPKPWEVPAVATSEVPLKDVVKQLAAKYDVEPDVLESFGRGAGAQELAEGPLQSASAAVGWVGEAAGGLPQKAVAKAYGLIDPSYEKAFDELREVIKERRSGLETAAQVATGLVLPAGVAGAAMKALPAAKIAASTAAGLISGGLAGLGGSKRGEEVEDMLTYAGVGAALGGTVGVAAKGVSKVAEKYLLKPSKEVLQKDLPNIEKGAAAILEKQAPRIDAMHDMISTYKPSTFKDVSSFQKQLSPETRASLAEKMVSDAEVDLALQNPKLKEALRKSFGVEEIDEVRDLLRQDMTLKKVQSELGDLRRRVGAKDFDEFDEIVEREGVSDILDNYLQMKQLDAASQHIADAGVRRLTSSESFEAFSRKLFDFKMIADVTDERLGLGLAPLLDDISKSMRAAGNMTSAARKRIQDNGLDDLLNKMTPADRTKLYKAAEGKAVTLDANGQKALSLLKDQFKWLGDTVEKVGKLTLKQKTNYVPHMLVDFPEYIVRMRRQSNYILNKVGAKSWDEVTDLDRPVVKEFVRALNLSKVGGAELNSGRAIGWALDEATKITARSSAESKASALFERQEAIPKFLLETDVRKLLDRYAVRTFRHLYMRNHIRKLGDLSKVAADAQDGMVAKEIMNLQQDLLGGANRGPSAWGQNLSTWLAVKAREEAAKTNNAAAKWIWESAEAAPDILSSLSNNIYANALGLNVKAFVRNLSQPMVMTAPELAGMSPAAHALTQKLGLRATASVWRDIATRKSISQDLIDEGFISEKFIDAGRDYLNRGVQQTWSGPAKAVNKLSDWAMTLYTASDIINRQVTRRMARDLAKLYTSGDTRVVEMVKRLPKSYRTRLAADPTSADKYLADYLMSNTQFNYDRANMSEFGRTMGKLFSVFTKWPTAVAGDIYKKTVTGQTDEALIKYLGPLLFFYMADAATPEKVKRDGRYDKLVGRGGFTSWAPGMSIKSLLTGGIMSPPIAQVAGEGISAMFDGDGRAAWRTMNRAAQSFAPGAGYIRFMTDDVPTYITGRRPEGQFLEKAKKQTEKAVRKTRKVIRKATEE